MKKMISVTQEHIDKGTTKESFYIGFRSSSCPLYWAFRDIYPEASKIVVRGYATIIYHLDESPIKIINSKRIRDFIELADNQKTLSKLKPTVFQVRID